MTQSNTTTTSTTWWALPEVQRSATAFYARAAQEQPRMSAAKESQIVDALHAANARERMARAVPAGAMSRRGIR